MQIGGNIGLGLFAKPISKQVKQLDRNKLQCYFYFIEVIISRVSLNIIKRKRVLVQACRLAHLSVCLSVRLSVCLYSGKTAD